MTASENLYLSNTRVTDAGLEHLRGLMQLRFLDLRGTQVTEAGVRELERALPNGFICALRWEAK